MAKKNTFSTREEWLVAFMDASRPIFKQHGYELPENIRVSIGFPSKGAKSKTIGECWQSEASEDDAVEIFITPGMGSAARIADILTHELIHALGIRGHKADFKKCMLAVGLAGKPTATVAGDGWWEWAQPILDKLGPLPHAALAGNSTNGKKKQTTRMLKCECQHCGIVFRTSAKHVERVGRCPDLFCDGQINIG